MNYNFKSEAASSISVVPVVRDGYQCYRTKCGEIGMARPMLAEACGVTTAAVDFLAANREKESLAFWFAPLARQDVILTRERINSRNQGRSTVIFKWEFCEAVINYYRAKRERIQQEIPAVPVIYKGYNCYKTPSGEIGMSRQNLLDAGLINSSTLDWYLNRINANTAPKWLAHLTKTDLTLTRLPLKTSGGTLKTIFKWEFCQAIISRHEQQVQKRERKMQEREKNAVRLVYLRKISD